MNIFFHKSPLSRWGLLMLSVLPVLMDPHLSQILSLFKRKYWYLVAGKPSGLTLDSEPLGSEFVMTTLYRKQAQHLYNFIWFIQSETTTKYLFVVNRKLIFLKVLVSSCRGNYSSNGSCSDRKLLSEKQKRRKFGEQKIIKLSWARMNQF